ncbi:MAG TPA: hypothetical protein VGN09_10270 [Vicinamibacteria bacterium]|jgi:hypothetical protein
MKPPALAPLALFAFAASLASAQEAAVTKETDTGPKHLVITYRATPANRAAFRQYMLKTGVARFERYRKDAVVDGYRLLFNRYVDADTWDLLALLDFKDYAQATGWKDVEAEAPGGLSAEALALAAPVHTYSMDLIRRGASPTPAAPGKSVFFVIPYDYLVATPEYTKYLDEYVLPQLEGWVGENVVATWAIYLNRYATSRPWKSLFILEYRDAAAFGARERTVEKVRVTLRSNPVWKARSDSKASVRVEKETAVADELLPRP